MKLLSHVQLFATPWTVAYPVSSIHGIFQARILEWVAISFSRRSSRPRDWTWVSCIVGRHFTVWATDQRSSQIFINFLSKTTLMKQVQLLSPFYRWRNWGTESVTNWPRTTQRGRWRTRSWPTLSATALCCPWIFFFSHLFHFLVINFLYGFTEVEITGII